MYVILRNIGTHSVEADSMSFFFFYHHPQSRLGSFLKNEFAPIEANSSLKEFTPL